MRKTVKIKDNTLLYIILFLLILCGCAKKDELKNIPDEAGLRERVAMYWDYKVKGEFDKSYEYEIPLYKKQVSMVNYIKGINTSTASWVGAEVGNINIVNDSATVDMKLRLKIAPPRMEPPGGVDFQKQPALSSPKAAEAEAFIKEQWMRVDGSWYHLPSKMLKERGNN